MEIIHANIKNNWFEILPFFDLHYGSKECNEGLIRSGINYLKTHSNCYAFLGGDIIESAIYGTMGNVHTQKRQVNEQVENIVEFLFPIRKRFLFGICGNHEFRIEKATGLNIMKLICNTLEIPFCDWECHFAFTMKHHKILRCYAHHGTGTGNTSGAKINSLERLHFRSPFANIIICGHTHFPTNMTKEIRYIDHKFRLKTFQQYFISCGSCHESNGYVSMKGLSPIGASLTKIKIFAKEQDFEIEIKKLRENV